VNFAKWHGAGNDFLLFFAPDAPRLAELLPRLAPRLCHRHFGVGADGVLLLEPVGEDEVRVHYFNSDGSRAAFCANGTRCAAAFAARRLGVARLLLRTDFAPVPAQVLGTEVTLHLPPPERVVGWLELPVAGSAVRGFSLTVGVPHLVVPVPWERFWEHPLEAAPQLRSHGRLGPEGANVHFAQPREGELLLRSYERGVEGETLACGSGAVAAALVAAAEGWLAPPIEVRTASGRVLRVAPEGGGPFGPATLTGPAEPVAQGELAPELLALPED